MKLYHLSLAALGILLLISCGPSAEELANRHAEQTTEEKSDNSASPEATSTSPAAAISSSAAVEKNTDSSRKFVRTAELKFRVKNVIHSTYDIEGITTRHGGFVTSTELNSTVDNVVNTAVSADSSLETTYYTVSNNMTLRVPNVALDTVLKEIARNIAFLDYRIIKADDVALQLLSNKLTVQRYTKNEKRLTEAIDKRGKKLNETENAEMARMYAAEQADNARLSSLSLNDQIRFSTINLIIYQRQTLDRELLYNGKDITAYEPGFGEKLLYSLQFGWRILAAIIQFLVKIWGILFLVIIGIVVYKIIARRKRNHNTDES